MKPLKKAYLNKWNQRSKIIYYSWKQEVAWLCSFDHFGITLSNLADFGSQLRHFARINKLVDDIEPVDPAIILTMEMDQHSMSTMVTNGKR